MICRLDTSGHLEKLWIYQPSGADGKDEKTEVNADKTESVTVGNESVNTLRECSFIMPSANNVVRCCVRIDAMGDNEQDARLVFDFIALAENAVQKSTPDEGAYNLSAKAITASTYGSDEEKEFALSRQFDPNIKLTVDSDGKMKLSLLYKPSNIDMKKLAIDDVEGVKTEYGKDATGTAYEFTMDIADITSDHKLSFSYDTGVPTLGDNGVMTHSVYLKDYQTSDWNGYDWKPGLAEGTYNLSVKAITASTYGSDEEKEFALSRQFDPNIKLTVDGDGKMKLSLLYKPSKIDMKKLAIDNVEGVKTEYGKDATGTAYEFTMDIADITSDHKLSFSYDTGVPTLGDNGVMTHSVYLKDYQTSDWNGYDWKPGLAEGTYNLSVKAITASTYGSDEEKEFALSRQFDPNIKLTVDGDGKMKLSLLYKPSKIDMKKLAIDDVEGVKTEYGKDATGVAYEFTMDIADITSDHKLSFSYDTGVPTLGDNGVMTHSVYLKDYQISDWNGYDWKPARLTGDVDGDGEITISDATAIQMYLAELAELDSEVSRHCRYRRRR